MRVSTILATKGASVATIVTTTGTPTAAALGSTMENVVATCGAMTYVAAVATIFSPAPPRTVML